MLRTFKLLTITFLLGLGLSLVTPMQALATTAPVFTSAAYTVGTGILVITGSNFVPNININLTDINITDGKENSYTLTTKGTTKNETITKTSANIVLSATDAAALAKFLDNPGSASTNDTNATTKALNGGLYQINVYNGWDGTTSTTDVSPHQLTVGGVVTLSSATYDPNTGNLIIAVTNMVSTSAKTQADILPKYFTITDGATNSYTLTTTAVVKVTAGTTATIILNATDQLALQTIFNKAGESSVAGHNYNITAAYGWNGPLGVASMGSHVITQEALCTTATLNVTAATVVCGSPITTIATNKVGTIYVVPTSDNVTTATPQTTLDADVAGGTALKISADPTKLISIPTKTSATTLFTFTKNTGTFNVVEVNGGGMVIASNLITINNVPAPTLTATAAPGSAVDTTKVTATIIAGTQDTLAYKFSSSPISIPTLGTPVTLATTSPAVADSIYAYAYTSADRDITGVDTTNNKYLAIYELNANNDVVKFKVLTLKAANIKAPSITAASVYGSTLTLTTTTALNTANVPGTTAFTVKIGKVANLVTNVAISGTSITLTLTTAVTSSDTVTVAYTKPSTSYLQDLSGNAFTSITALTLSVSYKGP